MKLGAHDVGLVVGGLAGFYLGRLRAEVGATWHAGRRAMTRRDEYRRRR